MIQTHEALRLSRLCLGTMRLDGAGDAAAATRLLAHADTIGINCLHCSSEYGTFPLFLAAWRGLAPERRRQFAIVAKVAAPHFGESSFSAATFRARIESYRAALGVDRLDVVQWLLRYDLAQEPMRLEILARARDELSQVVEDLKAEGKIGIFVCFPYTHGIASAVLTQSYCDGIAVYLNLLERDMEPQIAAAGALGKAVFAIRPLAAGRILSEGVATLGKALDFVMGDHAVTTAIVSASSTSHLDALRPYLSSS